MLSMYIMGLFGLFGKKQKGASKVVGQKDNGVITPLGKVKEGDKKKIYDTLDEDARLGLDMAHRAYDNEDDRQDVGDYKYVRGDSDKNVAVYNNSKTGEAYIGYRGTKDLDDVKTDLTNKDGNILAGTQNKSDRFKASLDKYDAMKKKYGKIKGVAGHSLGGAIGSYISRERDQKAQLFNTGQSLFDGEGMADKAMCKLPKMLRPSYCDKTTRHRISNDPLSVGNKWGGYGTTNTYDGDGLGANRHSLDNFYK